MREGGREGGLTDRQKLSKNEMGKSGWKIVDWLVEFTRQSEVIESAWKGTDWLVEVIFKRKTVE